MVLILNLDIKKSKDYQKKSNFNPTKKLQFKNNS
jgi:hypothetical protein